MDANRGDWKEELPRSLANYWKFVHGLRHVGSSLNRFGRCHTLQLFGVIRAVIIGANSGTAGFQATVGVVTHFRHKPGWWKAAGAGQEYIVQLWRVYSLV